MTLSQQKAKDMEQIVTVFPSYQSEQFTMFHIYYAWGCWRIFVFLYHLWENRVDGAGYYRKSILWLAKIIVLSICGKKLWKFSLLSGWYNLASWKLANLLNITLHFNFFVCLIFDIFFVAHNHSPHLQICVSLFICL